MWLITKPRLARAAQAHVKVTQEGNYRRVEADIGALSDWICIVNHESNVLPPAGMGTVFSAGGVPHVHTPNGPVVLDDEQWVVALDGEPYIMTTEQMEEKFIMPKQPDGPTYDKKRQWMLESRKAPLEKAR